MIGCDHCPEWYHLSCLGWIPSEASGVEYYVCQNCQIRKVKKKTVYKSMEKIKAEVDAIEDPSLVNQEIKSIESLLKRFREQGLLDPIPGEAIEPSAAPVTISTPLSSTKRRGRKPRRSLRLSS